MSADQEGEKPGGDEPWKGWPSSTDKPLKPQLDAEAQKRAAAVVAAVIGSGSTIPVGVPGTFMGARTAAGTPERQKVDLRGLKDRMPADMPGLIDALLGNGARNQGIVFGDTNHLFAGFDAMLADEQAIAAMRRNGVTHVFIEHPPEELARQLRADNDSPAKKLARRTQAAGIKVVPMDMHGPAVRAHSSATQEFVKAAARSHREATLTVLERLARAADELAAERLRVTSQVWVPRIVETLRRRPAARFIVIAGDAHVNNCVLMNQPDINYEDLNESLARRLGAPVPYVRMEGDQDLLTPRVDRGGSAKDGPGVSDLTIHVPSLEAQRIQRSPLKNRPEEVRRRAVAAYQDYHRGLVAFTLGEIGLSKKQTSVLDEKDIQLTVQLKAAYEESLNGRLPEARSLLTKAEGRFAVAYPLEGAAEAQARIIRTARDQLGEMRRALDTLNELYGGRERPEIWFTPAGDWPPGPPAGIPQQAVPKAIG